MATTPSLECQQSDENHAGLSTIRLIGDWSIHAKIGADHQLISELDQAAKNQNATWDLTQLDNLDSVGAMLLWHAWGEKLPSNIQLDDAEKATFERLVSFKSLPAPQKKFDWLEPVVSTGRTGITIFEHFLDIVALIGMLVIDSFRLIRYPSRFPGLELSANIYRAGFQALFISALVGSMIGVAISYLLALQLQRFGGDTFIVPILGIGVLREIGPLIAAILIAGRSGSAMTAQIGVMRITEEIDALEAMGISPVLRLVLPKVLALVLIMPLIVFWCSIAGILGGLAASQQVLGIGLADFLSNVNRQSMFQNLWLALFKGVTFGLLIGIIACHFGLKVKQNSESLSQGTTSSVVTSITVVMLVDAFYAIIFQDFGL